ncbi:MAG: type II toxin-antitoxin system VapC family toxin [Fimbriimonadales bacterium]|nr:type II toxin-antitoxin system VapC family toxin [Fimbriimonadales bacterium]
MNGYLLDTDIAIETLRKNPAVLARLSQAEARQELIAIHALTFYETLRGLVQIQAQRQLREFELLCDEITILQTSRSALETAARLYAELAARGQLIGNADILIGAAAVSSNLIVVTHNLKHFSRIPSLVVEDWTISAP